MIAYCNKTIFRSIIFKIILLSLILFFVTVCSDSNPTDSVDTGKWIHTTIDPTLGIRTDYGYIVTISHEAFHGQYHAEMYFENTDGSWYLAAPFYNQIVVKEWFLLLYLYEGKIKFQYPDYYSLSPFNVRILVLYQE